MRIIFLFVVILCVVSYGSAMHESAVVCDDAYTQIAGEPDFWERQARAFIEKHITYIVFCHDLFVDELEEIYCSACRNIAQANDKKVLEDMFTYTHYPRLSARVKMCCASSTERVFCKVIDGLRNTRKSIEALQYMHYAFGSTVLDSPDAQFLFVGRAGVIFTGPSAKSLAERVKFFTAAVLAQLLF